MRGHYEGLAAKLPARVDELRAIVGSHVPNGAVDVDLRARVLTILLGWRLAGG